MSSDPFEPVLGTRRGVPNPSEEAAVVPDPRGAAEGGGGKIHRVELEGAMSFEGKLERTPLVRVGPVQVYATSGSRRLTAADRRLEIELQKLQWDIATVGTGVGVGAAFGHIPGAIIGGLVFGGWGRWRWNQLKPPE